MHTFERTANYYETDQMGIVHHSNYIRWFEEARLDFLDQIGLPYRMMEESGVWIPVLGVSCTYKHPVCFDETVVIETSIHHYNSVRFSVYYTVKNKASGVLCCTGVSEHCFTTPDLKPMRISHAFPKWHEAFLAENIK